MARIRTIKPEFWRHEGLSALPEATHMLAAALLTYADDHGYFNANAKLIEAECFPLRKPSVSVQESLTYLVVEGYIQLGNDCKGRRYGRIVNFAEHQRVSHPKESKIACLSITWEPSRSSPEISGSPPEVIAQPPEDFRPEQGTGNREQGTGNMSSAIAAPAAREPSPVEFIFGSGLKWLVANSGETEKRCRSLIGSWRKTRGDPEVAAALVAAQKEGVSQPIEWISKRFSDGKSSGSRGRDMAATALELGDRLQRDRELYEHAGPD
jgi:hypothetical protein